MKKIIALLLCLSLLGCLWGCVKVPGTPDVPVQFYYPQASQKDALSSAGGLVSFELRESAGNIGKYAYLTQLYLQGPVTETLRNPFPRGTTLKSLLIKNGIVYLVLSDAIASLSGTELTLACACLTRTIYEMTGFRVVNIQAETQLLGGSRKLIMNVKDLQFMDNSTAVPSAG